MARIRPSLVLQFDIPSELNNDAALDEVKRSFSYIAPVVCTMHGDQERADATAEPKAASDEAQHVLAVRMTVRLHRPYWDRTDPSAQQTWTEAMEPWLRNMFVKLSSAMEAFCRLEHPGIDGKTSFERLEAQFDDNAVVTIELAEGSSIPDDALSTVNAHRDGGNGALA